MIGDYDALVAALVGRKLTPGHAAVAQVFLNHPEDVALSTIVRLAERAQVTPATITRFAQELGFQGFPDLQRIFRERLVGPRLPYAAQLARLGEAPADPADLAEPGQVFDTFVQAAVGSLLALHEGLDRPALSAVVDVLAAAPVIHIAAARGAYGVGAYAFYGLAKVGKRARMIDNLGAMRAEQVAGMAPGDVLFAITFGDYTPETIEIAREAMACGQAVVAITDNELSPVVPLAAQALYVREARLGHFRSQVPALVVAQALIVSVGRRTLQADLQN
jgi:DNA-binding MurR/RpiR family transcriptional regulator